MVTDFVSLPDLLLINPLLDSSLVAKKKRLENGNSVFAVFFYGGIITRVRDAHNR